MLWLPRLVDLLHPRYQNDLFLQGKQLWTLKVDKHCNLFLFYCNIRYLKSSYQSRTETANNLQCWKHRLTTCSSSNSCTSGEEWLCRDSSQFGPTRPIIKPIKAASSSALLVHKLLLHREGWNQIQQLQVRSTPGREPGTVDTTPGRGHPCSQSHGTNLVLQPKFTNVHTSSSIFFPFCPHPGIRRHKSSCLGHSHRYPNYCKDKNILRKCKWK